MDDTERAHMHAVTQVNLSSYHRAESAFGVPGFLAGSVSAVTFRCYGLLLPVWAGVAV
jgi:hypothetical protein